MQEDDDREGTGSQATLTQATCTCKTRRMCYRETEGGHLSFSRLLPRGRARRAELGDFEDVEGRMLLELLMREDEVQRRGSHVQVACAPATDVPSGRGNKGKG